jgi:hypothetical protein
MKDSIKVVIKICVSAAILYFLFSNMDMKSFWHTLISIKRANLALAIVMLLLIQMTSTYRWATILSKDATFRYTKLLSIYLIGMFFNNFLPTIIGGDLIKGYYLYRESGKGGLALASVFMDRYSGFTALMVITLVAVMFGGSLLAGTGLSGFFVLLIGGYTCASLVIWVDSLHGWAMRLATKIHLYGINEKIDKFYRVLMGYKSHGRILAVAFGCSMIVQAGVIVIYIIIGNGLGIDIPALYYFLFIPLAAAASMLPISLAGLGVREGVFIYLFSKVGVPQEQALTLSLVFVIATTLISLVGGIEYVRLGGKKGMGEPKAEG